MRDDNFRPQKCRLICKKARADVTLLRDGRSGSSIKLTVHQGSASRTHMPQKLTQEIITAAIAGFEAQKRHIDSNIAELRNMLHARHAVAAAASSKPMRKISLASRRRMALAQKRRWAAIRGHLQANSAASPHRLKRRISEEGRRRIIAATKKRWVLIRAQEAKANRSVAKNNSMKRAGIPKAA